MTRVAPRFWVFSALALGLAIQGLFAPQARASCGDYVTIVRSDGSVSPHDMPQPPGEQWPSSGPSSRSLVVPGKQPCQGPWCSGSHRPLTAPASTVEQARDHWACWWSAFLCDISAALGSTCLVDEAGRVHRVFPFFHPPRAY